MSLPHFVAIQSPSHIRFFATPWTAAHQDSVSLTTSWNLFAQVHVHFISVACSAISSSDTLSSFCPQSFPASETFPMSHLFPSDDQNTGASTSASVILVNILGWSPFSLTGLISLLSKRLSRVFSSTTVRRHQFFGVLPSLRSSSHNHMWPLGRP